MLFSYDPEILHNKRTVPVNSSSALVLAATCAAASVLTPSTEYVCDRAITIFVVSICCDEQTYLLLPQQS